jgi:hypothetical protein
MKTIEPNWRNESGMCVIVEYKKKFAIFPTKCTDGTTAWFKHYYKKYEYWSATYSNSLSSDEDYMHIDFIGCISEADYIILKLTEIH